MGNATLRGMVTAIGATGAGIILIFFILNEIHKISTDNVWYDLGNFFGSFLLVIYAYLLGSIPFLILNAVWAIFSLKEVVSSLRSPRT